MARTLPRSRYCQTAILLLILYIGAFYFSLTIYLSSLFLFLNIFFSFCFSGCLFCNFPGCFQCFITQKEIKTKFSQKSQAIQSTDLNVLSLLQKQALRTYKIRFANMNEQKHLKRPTYANLFKCFSFSYLKYKSMHIIVKHYSVLRLQYYPSSDSASCWD